MSRKVLAFISLLALITGSLLIFSGAFEQVWQLTQEWYWRGAILLILIGLWAVVLWYVWGIGVENRALRAEVAKLADTQSDRHTDQVERKIFQSTLLANISDAVITTDLAFNITSWNKVAERMYGWKEEEVLGNNMADILPTDYPTETEESVLTEFREHGAWKGDAIQFHRNGNKLFVSSSVTLVRDQNGNPLCLLGVNRDITERKLAEDSLRRSERNLARALTIAKLGSWEFDPYKLEGYWSEEMYTIYGYDPQLPPPTKEEFRSKIHPEDLPAFLQTDSEVLSTDEILSVDFRYYLSPNELKYIHGFVHRDPRPEGGFTIVGTVQDVTEVKLVEESLRAHREHLEELVAERTLELNHRVKQVEHLNQQLEAANQELEGFSYSVSHDLRAPLRHINGFSGLLQRRERDRLNPSSVEFLDSIVEAVHKMKQLIDDLLDFSRTSRAELVTGQVDLNLLLDSVRAELSEECKGRQIEWIIPELPLVEADQNLLRIVWLNLLSNAIKFTAPRPVAQIEIGIEQEHNDDQTIFFVKDNGVGFDPQYVENLFAAFQRLHRIEDFDGTGVGLATVRRIIQRHEGKVWAESREGEGATFYFSLPTLVRA